MTNQQTDSKEYNDRQQTLKFTSTDTVSDRIGSDLPGTSKKTAIDAAILEENRERRDGPGGE